MILGAYFLSQVGFINRVSNGPIHSYVMDFDRLKTSKNTEVKISLFYPTYIPEQDVSSAVWLSRNRIATTKVYADLLSKTRVLFSYGLVPDKLAISITNKIITEQDGIIYLSTSNIVDGVIAIEDVMSAEAELVAISEIAPIFDKNNLIYSNGASEIWSPSWDG